MEDDRKAGTPIFIQSGKSKDSDELQMSPGVNIQLVDRPKSKLEQALSKLRANTETSDDVTGSNSRSRTRQGNVNESQASFKSILRKPSLMIPEIPGLLSPANKSIDVHRNVTPGERSVSKHLERSNKLKVSFKDGVTISPRSSRAGSGSKNGMRSPMILENRLKFN